MKTLNMLFSLGGLIAVAGIEPSFSADINPAPREATLLAASPDHSPSPPGGVAAQPSKQAASQRVAGQAHNHPEGTGAAKSVDSTPTYLRDVLPIVMGKCFRCHNQQTTFLNNWLDYRKAFADRWEIKRRVWDSWKGGYFKQPMPTGNSPESEVMTEEERALLKEWVEAGALYGVRPKETETTSKPERLEVGRRVFTSICAACHQPSGHGIPNRFPPLAGSDFLNSDKERAIKVVLNGLQGEVTVNGMKFNNSMPLLPLSDGEIAAALTFVYNSFGNSGKDVTPNEVKALRGNARSVTLSHGPANSATEKSPWE